MRSRCWTQSTVCLSADRHLRPAQIGVQSIPGSHAVGNRPWTLRDEHGSATHRQGSYSSNDRGTDVARSGASLRIGTRACTSSQTMVALDPGGSLPPPMMGSPATTPAVRLARLLLVPRRRPQRPSLQRAAGVEWPAAGGVARISQRVVRPLVRAARRRPPGMKASLLGTRPVVVSRRWRHRRCALRRKSRRRHSAQASMSARCWARHACDRPFSRRPRMRQVHALSLRTLQTVPLAPIRGPLRAVIRPSPRVTWGRTVLQRRKPPPVKQSSLRLERPPPQARRLCGRRRLHKQPGPKGRASPSRRLWRPPHRLRRSR